MSSNERDQVGDSHARLASTLASLSDVAARRPSLLPGWTVGHVLTHLARNADSFVHLLHAASRREVADQYPGGARQREGDIEAGAGRPAADLVADVLKASARLEATWSAVTEDVWRTGAGRFASGPGPLADLPFRRWREVEIHHVDLDLGYGWADWPDAYVDAELERAVAGLPARLPSGTALDMTATDTGERWVVGQGASDALRVRGDRRLLLAWLMGRAAGEAFPPLAPWSG
ncbi:MAG: maleylpyruvate isomerase family mycothiol-dependent enzyme [Actinomycetota bacterium]|nr:maleylpyruvate isomerase family mycothiol-dependent enzyme [Actinomycetota bacterium]